MGRWHWIQDENGHSRMVEAPEEDVAPVSVAQPAKPELSAAAKEKAKRYVCIACEPPKRFAKPGILSMHFARVHASLKEDRDSWREFMEVLS